MTTMQAMVRHRYGPAETLSLERVDRPELTDDTVLIRVHASSVNPADWYTMTGTPYVVRPSFGLLRPRSPRFGMDGAGVIEAVGANVEGFDVGDRVYGEVGGGYADYTVANPAAIARIPDGVGFDEAAALPVAALTALQGLRKGGVSAGDRVLINGASGGVGHYTVQVARWMGAHVTGVCSTRNLEMVRRLGADAVLDYTTTDITRTGPYDVIFDTVGNHSGRVWKRMLVGDGRLVVVGAPKGGKVLGPALRIPLAHLPFLFGSKKSIGFIAKADTDDLALIVELMGRGEVRSEIEQTYPLADLAAAMDHLATGRTRGKLVISIREG